MIIDVATIVLLNYCQSSIAQSEMLIELPNLIIVGMSYKSVHHDFLAGLEEDSILHVLKYNAFHKLWHQISTKSS